MHRNGVGVVVYDRCVRGAYTEALEYSEQSLSFATQSLRTLALGAKASALVALRRIEEGAKLLEEVRRCCEAGGGCSSVR